VIAWTNSRIGHVSAPQCPAPREYGFIGHSGGLPGFATQPIRVGLPRSRGTGGHLGCRIA
jgi:hypothetical protein